MATSSKRQQAQRPAAGPANVGLQVVSSREGFRRAGYAFGREPRVIPLAELTAEQVEAIKDEPMLAAVEVEIPPSAEGEQTT